jgi:hypothetical protein
VRTVNPDEVRARLLDRLAEYELMAAFTPLFYILWIAATILVVRLWRALPAWRRHRNGVA